MDSYIAHLCDKLGELGSGIPDALRIYKHGRACLLAGDRGAAKKAEVLNYLLHSSVIPSECRLADDVVFGYGGIGIILHANVSVGSGVVIGSNVTLGGGGAKGRHWTDPEGRRVYAPRINDHVYIATGAKVLGGVEVGSLSVIGANSVVISDFPPLSVVVGAPARTVRRISIDNCMRYKSEFYTLRGISDEQFVDMVAALSATQQKASTD
jgi:serine O-acetyltransferase